jgi:hypothetical protein
MSYSRKDEIVMRQIVTFLRNQGIKVWVDNEKLVPGTPIWEVEIEKAIKGASAVIVILSPDSKDSVWVRREISYAEQYSKRIFPVMARGDEDSSITLRLITRQYVDIRNNEDIGLNSLNSALLFYLEELDTQQLIAQENAEKLAKAQAERDAAEKAVREALEKAAKEKADREAAEREAARLEKEREAIRLKAEREAAKKAERETARLKAGREAAEKALQKANATAQRKAEQEAKKKKRSSSNPFQFYILSVFFAVVIILILSIAVIVIINQSNILTNTVAVSAKVSQGVSFDCPVDGDYTVTLIPTGSAYSPWPSNDPGNQGWETLLFIYVNKSQVSWASGPDPRYGGPTNFDTVLGSSQYFNTEVEAENALSKEPSQKTFYGVKAGKSCLIFVAGDDHAFYADNRDGTDGPAIIKITYRLDFWQFINFLK